VLSIRYSGRFKRDVRRLENRGKVVEKLKAAMRLLAQQESLPAAYGDHPLKGEWKGYRDIHIEPDWILIYRIVGTELLLVASGTHVDLFEI
jgi:mRNA interferase YafQ